MAKIQKFVPKKYKTFFEVFEALEATNQYAQKVQILEANDSNELRAFMVLAYHPNVEWLLPDGEPPYKPNKEAVDEKGHLTLKSNLTKFNLFLKDRGYNEMKQPMRETRFIQLLESVTPLEARWILQAKCRNLEKCSDKVVRKAYPGLLPESDEDR